MCRCHLFENFIYRPLIVYRAGKWFFISLLFPCLRIEASCSNERKSSKLTQYLIWWQISDHIGFWYVPKDSCSFFYAKFSVRCKFVSGIKSKLILICIYLILHIYLQWNKTTFQFFFSSMFLLVDLSECIFWIDFSISQYDCKTRCTVHIFSVPILSGTFSDMHLNIRFWDISLLPLNGFWWQWKCAKLYFPVSVVWIFLKWLLCPCFTCVHILSSQQD